MMISDAATVAAARIAAKLREEFAGPAEIDATVCEDDRTVLVFAGLPGRTVTTATDVSELGGLSPETFARRVEKALAR